MIKLRTVYMPIYDGYGFIINDNKLPSFIMDKKSVWTPVDKIIKKLQNYFSELGVELILAEIMNIRLVEKFGKSRRLD